MGWDVRFIFFVDIDQQDGTNSKTDDKGIKDSKQDTDAKCDEPEVKRKDKFDTKTGDQARGKDGDDKSLDEKENGTEPSSVTGSNESTEDNKTGGDEKDAGQKSLIHNFLNPSA